MNQLKQIKTDVSGNPMRLSGIIAEDIGTSILSGQFAPGKILTGEIDACAKLDISRSAYREAIRTLAAKGLVEARPKAGTKVSERQNWHLLDPDVVGWTFAKEPDWDLIQSLFELRNIVESHAAALAAVRRSDAQLKRMRDALHAMARHTLATAAGREADLEFHTTLLQATGNSYIISLTSGINAAIAVTTIFKQRKRPLRRDPVPDHLRVLDAVAARKPQVARNRMSELILLALEDTPVKRPAKIF
jgi:DNA-binding FadR family transcriptional regulator